MIGLSCTCAQIHAVACDGIFLGSEGKTLMKNAATRARDTHSPMTAAFVARRFALMGNGRPAESYEPSTAGLSRASVSRQVTLGPYLGPTLPAPLRDARILQEAVETHAFFYPAMCWESLCWHCYVSRRCDMHQRQCLFVNTIPNSLPKQFQSDHSPRATKSVE